MARFADRLYNDLAIFLDDAILFTPANLVGKPFSANTGVRPDAQT